MPRLHDVQDLFFPVEEHPVFVSVRSDTGEQRLPVPNRKAIVNASPQRVLGVVSRGYEVVTNQQALDWARQCCATAFRDTGETEWQVHAADAPGTGSHCCIDLVHNSGAVDFSLGGSHRRSRVGSFTHTPEETIMNRHFMAAAALACLTACGGSSGPTAPSIPSAQGTWVGSITSSSAAGSGPARVTLSQNAGNLTGTWTATGPTGTSSGTLTGSVSASAAVTMTLSPSVPTECPFAVAATMSGNQMSGTYSALNCTISVSGGITLTRQ